jgi:hypothetical protein
MKLMAFEPGALMGPVQPLIELLPGVPAEAYTLVAGALSAGKSTLLHSMLMSKATGHDLLGLGGSIDPGPAVLLSYEDTDRLITRRFQILTQTHFERILDQHGTAVARRFVADLERHLFRKTLTGLSQQGIVCWGGSGEVVENYRLLDELAAAVRECASEGVLMGLDPLRLAIVGSQSDDNGSDAAVRALNFVATSITNSALVIPSHTTKSGAVDPARGQTAAAYSTSGSALYSQHARSNFLLAKLSIEEAARQFTDSAAEEAIQGQRIVQLIHARLSHAPESPPRYYLMQRGALLPIRPDAETISPTDAARRALPAIEDAIRDIAMRGTTVSRAALEANANIGRTRAGRRAILDACIAQQWLKEEGTTRNRKLTLTGLGLSQLSLNLRPDEPLSQG